MYLHFADNSQLPQYGQPGYDKLGKVRPVLEALQSCFLQLYDPHCEQGIDENEISRDIYFETVYAGESYQVYTGRAESNERG